MKIATLYCKYECILVFPNRIVVAHILIFTCHLQVISHGTIAFMIKYVMAYFIIFLKILKYIIVFVFTSTHKYVLLCHHRIYTEIRSYLLY